MPYKDPEKQKAAVAAAMKRRYWKDPEAARKAQNTGKFERRRQRRFGRALESAKRLVKLAEKLARPDQYGIVRLERQ